MWCGEEDELLLSKVLKLSETKQKSQRTPLLLSIFVIMIILVSLFIVAYQYNSLLNDIADEERKEERDALMQREHFGTVAQAFALGLGLEPELNEEAITVFDYSYSKRVTLEELTNLTKEVQVADDILGYAVIQIDNYGYLSQYLIMFIKVRITTAVTALPLQWYHCYYYVLLHYTQVEELIEIE